MQEEPSDNEIFVDAAGNKEEIIEEANLVNVTLKEAMTGNEGIWWMEAITGKLVVQVKIIRGK